VNSPKTGNQLTREAVVDHALQVADVDGLDGLTIRRLAQDFGVTPMALYWHFGNKEELLDAVGERVVAEMRIPGEDGGSAENPAENPDADDLVDYLRRVLRGLVDALRQHPGVATLAASRMLACEPGLSLAEQVLGRLRAAGVSDQQASTIARSALQSAIQLVTGFPGGEATLGESGRLVDLERKQANLRAIPPDRFPNVVACSTFLLDCFDEDAYYAEGIEIFVSGLAGATRSEIAGVAP
jgi:AcrR family transcriptional regulator